jgi:hypothetical protein
MNEKMEQETQSKTENSIIDQPQNNTKLLRIMTGYNQHAGSLLVLFLSEFFDHVFKGF